MGETGSQSDMAASVRRRDDAATFRHTCVLEGVMAGGRREAVRTRGLWAIVALLLWCAVPARANADPVPTIKLDRDGPVTVLVQSKSAAFVLGMAVASPSIVSLCTNCLG